MDFFLRQFDGALEDAAARLGQWIGVDSLRFISLDGLYRAVGEAMGRDAASPQYCDACFSGQYPISPSDKIEEGFTMKAAE